MMTASRVESSPAFRAVVRWTLRALCFLLVPVVWVAQADAASAATTVATAEIHEWGYLDAADCTLSAYFVQGIGPGNPPGAVKIKSLNCSTGPNVKSLTVDFTIDGGTGCSYEGTSSELDDQGAKDVILAQTDETYEPTVCVVAELCYTLHAEGHVNPFYTDHEDGCVPLPLGSPPAPFVGNPPPAQTACEAFDAGRVNVWFDKTVPSWSDYAPPSSTQVMAHIRVRGTLKNAGPDAQAYVQWDPGAQAAGPLTFTGENGAHNFYKNADGYEWTGIVNVGAPGVLTPQGLTVMVMSSAYQGTGLAGTYWDQQRTFPHKRLINGWTSDALYRYKTDPGNCLWTFGQKRAADDPNSTLDDPMGPITATAPGAEPVPDPDPEVTPTTPETAVGCGFSFTDPATWASGGICETVRMLHAIGGALAAIPGAILNGLSGLFVPSPGAMDAASGELKATWENSSVGTWQDSIDANFSSAMPGAGAGAAAAPEGSAARVAAPGEGGSAWGGCKGPPLTWDKLTAMGLPETLYIFDACTGTSATLAYWCHFLLTAFIGVTGFMKIFEMILASVGVHKQISIMRGFDWSDAAQNRHGDRA